METLENLSKGRVVAKEGVEYELVNGNKIVALADGYPINFYSSESVPLEVIDIVLTELFLSATKLAQNKYEPGIKKCPIDEKDIAKVFEGIHYS